MGPGGLGGFGGCRGSSGGSRGAQSSPPCACSRQLPQEEPRASSLPSIPNPFPELCSPSNSPILSSPALGQGPPREGTSHVSQGQGAGGWGGGLRSGTGTPLQRHLPGVRGMGRGFLVLGQGPLRRGHLPREAGVRGLRRGRSQPWGRNHLPFESGGWKGGQPLDRDPSTEVPPSLARGPRGWEGGPQPWDRDHLPRESGSRRLGGWSHLRFCGVPSRQGALTPPSHLPGGEGVRRGRRVPLAGGVGGDHGAAALRDPGAQDAGAARPQLGPGGAAPAPGPG